MNNYFVQVIRFDNEKIVEEFGPYSERKAEKVDRGINININHYEFYTLITEKETT
jgi:hypothetical protein